MVNRKHKPATRSKAAAGVCVSASAKIALIRKFQRAEGNFDCCASAYTRVCKQAECLWRDECLTLVMG